MLDIFHKPLKSKWYLNTLEATTSWTSSSPITQLKSIGLKLCNKLVTTTLSFWKSTSRLKTIKQKPQKIHLYNKGDWPAIQKGLADILDSLGTLQNINDMWLLFETKCLDLMDRHIPTKLTKVYNGLPWVNQNLKWAIRCHNRVWSMWKNQTLKLPTVITSALKSITT